MLSLFRGVVIGPCFAMHYLVAFRFCNHLAEEEIAGSFTLMAFLLAMLIVLVLCVSSSRCRGSGRRV